MTSPRSRARRRLVLLACLAAAPIVALATPTPPASAHTCAQVRVWVSGSPIPVGGCHYPGGSGDICNDGDLVSNGYGAGHTVCLFVPVR